MQTGITLIVSFYTTRILVEKLGLSNFGVFWLLFGLSQAVLFFQPGLDIGGVRFLSIAVGSEYSKSNLDTLHEYPTSLSTRQIFNSVFLSYFILLLILLLLGPWLGYLLIANFLKTGDISLQTAYLIFLVSTISVAITIISAPYRALLIAHKRFDVFNLLAALLPSLDLLGAYALPSLQTQSLTLLLYAIIKTFAALIASLPLILFCILTYDSARLSKNLLLNSEALSHIFSFVGWKMLSQSLYILRDKLVAFLVNSFFGPLGTSGYEISSKLALSQNKLIGTIQSTFTPTLGNLYGQNNPTKYFKTVLLVNKLSMLAAFILFMPVISYTKVIFIFWLGEYDKLIQPFIIALLIAFLIDRSSTGTMISIAMHGRIMYYEIAGGLSLFAAVPFSWFLYHRFESPYVFTSALIISALLLTITRIVAYCTLYHKNLLKELAGWALPMAIYIIYEIILYFAILPTFPQTMPHFLSYFIIHLFGLTSITFLLLMTPGERSLIFNRLRYALH